MKLKRFAYIFLLSKAQHNAVVKKETFCFKSVGIDIDQIETVVGVARDLLNEGYELIELCGGFGPEWIYKISEALDNKIPVGGVFYGPGYYKSLLALD